MELIKWKKTCEILYHPGPTVISISRSISINLFISSSCILIILFFFSFSIYPTCLFPIGNPFYAIELVQSLLDANHAIRMTHRGGVTELTVPPSINLKEIGLPSTLQGVVMSRIDQLPPSLRQLLKTASVIGQQFSRQILLDILNSSGNGTMGNNESIVDGELRELEKRGFIRREETSRGSNTQFKFEHSAIQDVMYNLTTFSQRRTLHGEIAKWHERVYQGIHSIRLFDRIILTLSIMLVISAI